MESGLLGGTACGNRRGPTGAEISLSDRIYRGNGDPEIRQPVIFHRAEWLGGREKES